MSYYRMFYRLLCSEILVVVLTLSLSARNFAADGHMIIVTANPGKIMSGDKVLAEVPQGTRLWVFSSSKDENWIDVKVPNGDQHGWLLRSSTERLKLTAQQEIERKQALTLFDEYQKLQQQEDYAAASQKLEKCLKIERAIYGAEHPDVARSLHKLGNLSDSLGDALAARKYFDEALAIRRKVLGNTHTDTGSTLNNLGVSEQDEGDYPTARKLFEEALAIKRKAEGNEHAVTAQILHNLGFLCNEQEDYPAAQKFYAEALAIRRKVLGNQHVDTAQTLHNLGILSSDQGDYPAAQKFYEEALAIRRKVLGNLHADTAYTLYNIGLVTHEQRDYAVARKSYEEALAIRRKVLGNEHIDTADTLNNLGILAENQNDNQTARQFYEEALAIYMKVVGNEHTKIADTLNNMGVLLSNQMEYAAARKCHEEALAIRRKLQGSEHSSTAQTLNNLGVVISNQGDYPTARKAYEEALAIYRKTLGDKHCKTADTLQNLGILARDQGNYPAAKKHYEEALAIYRLVVGNEHTDLAETLNNLGVLVSDQGDYPAARKYYEEALAIKRKLLGNEHLSTAQTLNNLGNLASDQGDYAAARKYLDEALAIKRKILGSNHLSYADTLNNLGILASDQHDYPAAQKFYEEALAIYRKVLGNEHKIAAETLNNLGLLARRQKNIPAARQYYDESRRIMANHVQRTLSGLSETEQVLFLDNLYVQGWTRYLMFGWDHRGDAESASISTAWLINGKAVAQESLAARTLLTRDGENPQLAPLVQQLNSVRKRLAALALSTPKPNDAAARQRELDQLASDEQRLARSLAQATGEAPPDNKWVEFEAFRSKLPPAATYIDLVRMGMFDFKTEKRSVPHYLAWIIPAQGDIHILDLGEAQPIETALEKARSTLAAAQLEDGPVRTEGEAKATRKLDADLQTVANLVLKPLLPHLANKKHLILSPDGALWLLPWAALPIAENKCLLEQCSIRYVTSGRDLLRKPSPTKLGTTAPVIIVNPDYDLVGAAAKAAIRAVLPEFKLDENPTRGDVSRSSLPYAKPLTNTQLEGLAVKPSLEKITNLTPTFYEQEQALEAVVKKLQRPKQLLIATHGFFLPDQEVTEHSHQQRQTYDSTRSTSALTTNIKPIENPLLRCGLLFAGCNAPRTPGLDDGILTGLEIVGLDLRGTELVVLSACETGIGKVRNGEGVAGLRQAFQLAGAQSVVSTLWQVPDRDSALIMQDFFTNLAAGQSKADALRNAQLKRIEARKEKTGAAHPFFWAAWTVTGN